MAVRVKRVGPEEALLRQILTYARLRGWRCAHFRPGRTKDGWRTAIQGDAGFPDLVLARGGRVVFAELKSETGRLSAAQRLWLVALRYRQPAVWSNVFVWRPADWPQIEAILS